MNNRVSTVLFFSNLSLFNTTNDEPYNFKILNPVDPVIQLNTTYISRLKIKLENELRELCHSGLSKSILRLETNYFILLITFLQTSSNAIIKL